MTNDPNEVVKVFAGTLIEVEGYQRALADARVESRVVGTALTASFGSAIPGSIELWVHQSDFEKAVAAIKLYDEELGQQREQHHFSHPTSDPNPATAPHRKEPHVKQDPLGE